jgi:hypothetical protein
MTVKVCTRDSLLGITDVSDVNGLAEIAEVPLEVLFFAENAQV